MTEDETKFSNFVMDLVSTEKFCVILIKQQQKVEGGKSSSDLEVTIVCDLMTTLPEENLIFM